MFDDTAILARLHPSAARRHFGVAVVAAMAGLTLWLGAAVDSGLVSRLVLLGAGVIFAVGALILWRATSVSLVLTADGLFQTDGRRLARMESIARVDRGTFAMKPSNGFLVHLSEPEAAAWAPGLWWRIGRRVGVGGVTEAGTARAMADILSAHLDEGA